MNNIQRLGLANISYSMYNTNSNAYEPMKDHQEILYWKEQALKLNKCSEINRGVLLRTDFGKNFYEICIR